MGADFWEGMIKWVKESMLEKYATISAKDLDLIPITDDPDDVVKIINDFYEAEELKPNLPY
jgi:predicted Rossmann-fold nucleotide-binding protein